MMNRYDVEQDVMDEILASRVWKSQGIDLKLEESKDQEKENEDAEAVNEEETEEHTCPLCESTLEEALSDEKLSEHVDYILSIVEGLDSEGESLEEETEEEEDGSTE